MLSTIKKNQKFFGYIATALALCAFQHTSQAHELRNIGNGYWIQVGGDVEPPVQNQPNAMDFFAFYEGPNGIANGDYTVLDKTQGDTVKITAVGIRPETDSYNADIEGYFSVPKPFTQQDVEGLVAYVSGNFTFQYSGAYGYIVSGKLQKVGHPVKFFIQKFVCGGGSLDSLFGTGFECYEAAP
jgi:hypothetical protein